jgi:prepilin-type processing-associated H-X9-DG protein
MPDQNFWIAGSRLTCPYLTNSAVAVVAENYNSDEIAENERPIIEDKNYTYVNSPSDNDPKRRPYSNHHRHTNVDDPLKGNYLFLDSHVEWVERLTANPDPTPDPLTAQMFPTVPSAPAGAIPCP